MKPYLFSPEFQRNVWMHFTPARIWAVPVMIALIILSYVTIGESQPPAVVYKGLGMLMLMLYWAVAVLWGANIASTAMQDELRNSTWDFQRMSSISPAQLAFGKLFGATSYAWYGAFALWAVFTVCYGLGHYLTLRDLSDTVQAITGGSILRDFLYMTFFMFMAAFFAQAIAFYQGSRNMQGSDKLRAQARWRGNSGGMILGIIAGSWLFFSLVIPGLKSALVMKPVVYDEIPAFTWHGIGVAGVHYVMLSLLFFAVWIAVAIWRLMKAGLLHKTWPVAFPLFTASLALYLTGPMSSANYKVFFAVFFSLFVSYFAMFADATDIARYRRLYAAWTARNRARIFENLPLWATSFAVMALAWLALCALTVAGETRFPVLVFMTAIVLFAVRDGIVIHALSWRGGRDVFFIVLYYVLAYFLLPKLHMDASFNGFTNMLRVIGDDKVAVATAVAMYFPIKTGNFVVALLPVAVQIFLAGLYLRRIVLKKAA